MSFNISKPGLLAGISYLVMAFVILLPFNAVRSNGEVFIPNFSNRIIILLLMIIPFALSIYSINCMVIGKCYVWSWIQGVSVALWVLLFLTASFLSQESLAEQYRNGLKK